MTSTPTPEARLLVVEDEPNIRELLATSLRYAGFDVATAASGAEALRVANAHDPDLCVLDVMLPDMDGFTVTRRLREQGRQLPIVFVTARDSVDDKIKGLTVGGDDYVTKPFSLEEVVARIRAVLRRRAPEQASDSVAIGELVLDAGTYRVSFQGQPLKVGPTEFKLLHFLMRHAERVHSRSQLLDKVWGDHVFIEERTVDVHVKRLREALGAAAVMVETVRGAGYRLTAQPQVQLQA